MPSSHYVDDSLRSFLLKLSNRSPEPAGGAALALAGASAAALMSLACHPPKSTDLTAEDEKALVGCQMCSERLTQRIQYLIDEDVHAYREVTRCLRLPNGTGEQRDQRLASLDVALRGATEVPLSVAEAGLEILDLAISVAPAVRPPAAGDLAAAIHLAEAAIKGSLRNARINASAMSSGGYPREARDRIGAITERLEKATGVAAEVLRDKGVPD